ncbi:MULTISPECIES: PQQ-binding-like beta-propeller repeat protein [unclassified Paenibacillus]|uniref:PQQ-binding-like beta-propeller repeat protein n=1 Tax=unclassified Paenibacillus TaxID=185978 RepID=UPI000308DFB8|nr:MULTISPECIES: PQQ-binding-like beta-propeller repeat protein [unclassified Paenibacillus]EPD88670.1 hypothetical protein HMPREF1207_02099 [Paenibacillus sp. HGH0039]
MKRIKCFISIAILSCLFFTLETATMAATPSFSQGSAYQQGLYDVSSMQPLGANWNRNSQFKAVDQNIHLKWTYKMPSGGNSSVILDENGTLFVKSYEIGVTPPYKIHAINPDGTRKWLYSTTEELTNGSPIISKDKKLFIPAGKNLKSIDLVTGIANDLPLDNGYPSQPAIDAEGTIYLAGAGGRLAAYRPDGTQKWKSSFNTNYSPGYLALAANGTLYFKAGSNGYGSLYAYDSKTGGMKWEYTGVGTKYTPSAPALAQDGTIYVSGQEGFVYAVSPDGTLKWKLAIEKVGTSRAVIDPIVGPDGTIYAGNGTQSFVAINPDGTLKWTYAVGMIQASPIIDKNGTIYLGADGKVIALNNQGVQKWALDLKASVFTSAPAIAADGTIYIADGDGSVFAIGGEVSNPSEPETPTDPETPGNPDPAGRALLVITLMNGTEKEYDLSMKEVNQFITWYESKAKGTGPVSFAINKHDNNKGPFKQRNDYIIYDKIITFEVNEY